VELFALIAAIACALAVAALCLMLLTQISMALMNAAFPEVEDEKPQTQAPPFDPQTWHRLHRHHRHIEHRKARL
jgi:hypothetical protein